jgi:excisionase family DNA binding protein
MDKLYSVNDALNMLKISRAKLYLLMKDGAINPVKLGKRTLFKESELTRFIESLTGNKE